MARANSARRCSTAVCTQCTRGGIAPERASQHKAVHGICRAAKRLVERTGSMNTRGWKVTCRRQQLQGLDSVLATRCIAPIPLYLDSGECVGHRAATPDVLSAQLGLPQTPGWKAAGQLAHPLRAGRWVSQLYPEEMRPFSHTAVVRERQGQSDASAWLGRSHVANRLPDRDVIAADRPETLAHQLQHVGRSRRIRRTDHFLHQRPNAQHVGASCTGVCPLADLRRSQRRD